ncbi:MAG TPA: Rieske 2Fe-2S domain-containing protein [Roseiarcus sp.]|nr:Rieske 2Fe-2S domain-containing protein [Roseiarcus sp.]
MKHELVKIADIPEQGTKIVPFFGREAHVYFSEGRPRAVANVCLHFGGPLACKGGRLVCPWHEAAYDMASGERLVGPAPKGAKLMFLSTRVEGDGLFYVWGE